MSKQVESITILYTDGSAKRIEDDRGGSGAFLIQKLHRESGGSGRLLAVLVRGKQCVKKAVAEGLVSKSIDNLIAD